MTTAARVVRVILAFIATSCLSSNVAPANAWTIDEHRMLADRALTAVLADWTGVDPGLVHAAVPLSASAATAYLETLGFGAVSAWSARDDRAMARRHERGRTLLQQLRRLTQARIDSLSSHAAGGDAQLLSSSPQRAAARLHRLASRNPAACFLQYHLIALRLAQSAGPPDDTEAVRLMRRALIYEAIAQGYLSDAFASGHLMTPPGARPFGRARLNIRRTHDYYSSLGAYVLNARGETWQTFGDQLLLWYGPSFSHVFEASVTSLRELFLVHAAAGTTPLPPALGAWADSLERAEGVPWRNLAMAWCVSRDPSELLGARLPSLMSIPAPVVATWSVRTGAVDSHGIRKRHHYSQLADAGGHDPTLDQEDVERLPMRGAVTAQMIPDTLFEVEPLSLVRHHRDFASVRFAQPAEPPPSYAGLLGIAGGTRYEEASGGGVDHYFGLGYSPLGESAVLLDRVSVDVKLLTPDHGGRPRSTAVMLGASLTLPHFGIWRHWGLRWLDSVRLETGHAWTRGAGVSTDGSRHAVGLESPTLPVGFEYAGVTLRLGYQWTRLDRPRRGLVLETVLQ